VAKEDSPSSVPCAQGGNMLRPVAPTAPTAIESRLEWMALMVTPGLGQKRSLKAAEILQEMARLFRLSLTELEGLNFPAPAAQFLFSGKARAEAEQGLLRMGEQKRMILTYGD